ncbi:Ku protein [Metapseudomonas otitidis]|uniref:non-homologous end joining protein Ku n=1 Tax=Metapseudomonas otitidis TaxID=319939 RepID=UPI003216D642
MARAIWKGAISFGLVHIPVDLVSASSSGGVDFDWLDDRSMEPVGYRRVNKVTGKEVPREHIVKGVEHAPGEYVVLSEEEIQQAHPRAARTIDIFAFVDAGQIPLQNIDTPYYLSPDRRSGKVYALLRESLAASGKVALAEVVLRTRQYLAAVMPQESALVLVTLRWPADVKGLGILDLGSEVTEPTLAKGELAMAKRLIEDMTQDWQPDDYRDTFTEKVMDLVEQKAQEGHMERVERPDEEAPQGADIIDLTELLRRSLGGKGAKPEKSEKAAPAKAPRKRAPAKAAKDDASRPRRRKA